MAVRTEVISSIFIWDFRGLGDGGDTRGGHYIRAAATVVLVTDNVNTENGKKDIQYFYSMNMFTFDFFLANKNSPPEFYSETKLRPSCLD